MLVIPYKLYHVMLSQMEAVYPFEGCGLLAGQGRQVTHLYAMHNQLLSQVAYDMAPHELLAAWEDMEREGQEWLAVYHSHPHGPEVPSPTDIRLAVGPEVVYIIIAGERRNAPTMRGFIIRGAQVSEVLLIFRQ